MLKKQVKMNREPVPIDDVSPVMTENEGEVILEEMSEKDEDQVQSLPTTQKNQFPNTQLVEIAVTKEEKRKRNMNMNVSLLSVLLVIWSKEFLLDITMTLEILISLSLKEKQYEAKRYLHTLMESLAFVQKTLLAQKKELGKCSMRSLVSILLNSEWSTTYMEQTMSMETSNWITKCRKFSGAVLIIAHHGNHIHIVNDCSYSNNSCRCSFTNQLRKQINRRYARRVVPSWQFSLQHWVNLSIYLQKDSREYLYYNIAGRTWLPSGESRCLRFFEDLKKAEDGMVEGSQLSFDIFNKFSTGSEPPIDHEVIAICDQSDQSNSVNKKRGKGDKVSILQLQYIIF